jgi:hypothetical protein
MIETKSSAVPKNAVKAYGVMMGKLHALLTSELYGNE